MSKLFLYRLMAVGWLVMEAGSAAVASPPPPPPPSPPTLNIPIDDASGPRYRKIALNGLPMTDEKPQASAESDQEKEETYVDSLTLGLRHSTTDAYMPVSGSDFSLSARRDFRSQVWSQRYGLRPCEQPDLPFGMCWSSNLAPNIKFFYNNDPMKSTPDQAIVTDETGAVHTFCIWSDGGTEKFFPMPTAKNEAQVPNLETLTANSSVTVFTFQRRYGATLTYVMTTLPPQSISNDRLKFTPYSTTYYYARLTEAEDRVGNIVNYNYPAGNTTTLIPSTITVVNQPDITLAITQEPTSAGQNVITSIRDANGNTTTFGYSAAPSKSGDDDSGEVVLTSVTTPDGATTTYSYNNEVSDPDYTPHDSSDPGNTYFFVDIASITDPLGNAYSFQYALDHSKFNYMDNSSLPYVGYYIAGGCPRNIASVTMPDGTASTFVNNSTVFLGSSITNGTLAMPLSSSKAQDSSGHSATINFGRQNTITDATGFTRTYTFSDVYVASLPIFTPTSPGPVVMVYQQLDITYGTPTGPGGVLGSETIHFDINASMALASVTDFSGNTTTYTHGDPWPASPDYTTMLGGATMNEKYPDPTIQTDALLNTKTFAYDRGAGTAANPGTGIMTDVTDEDGNHTHYDFDSLGRRTDEMIYAPPVGTASPALVQETDFYYGNATYPGFMTKKCVKALGGSDPGWVKPLVTVYAPDADGRVAQETVDPGGSGHLNLVTAYTYDSNGNKLTTTDPLGHTTSFVYDSRNRLTKATYADSSYKTMSYDLRGNKTREIDENGHATLYAYDSLNRLVTQARDMNGDGAIDSGDLVTAYTYSAVNSKLTTTDPNGNVTTMAYDNMQRVSQITDAAGNATTFVYGANSGGDAFDSSSFKPTVTTDPRGFT
ncbi:MAG TPA: hypothetical protein VGZ93_08710, partial [Candidatus Methylacidiphilales bacterium]|nr:hypothetical protein [Candidatus Methylacidiphilales bacterium]